MTMPAPLRGLSLSNPSAPSAICCHRCRATSSMSAGDALLRRTLPCRKWCGKSQANRMPPFAIALSSFGGSDAPSAASCCTAAWAHALSQRLPGVLWVLAAMRPCSSSGTLPTAVAATYFLTSTATPALVPEFFGMAWALWL
eukprot:3435313-Amphidinium_carterae.1